MAPGGLFSVALSPPRDGPSLSATLLYGVRTFLPRPLDGTPATARPTQEPGASSIAGRNSNRGGARELSLALWDREGRGETLGHVQPTRPCHSGCMGTASVNDLQESPASRPPDQGPDSGIDVNEFHAGAAGRNRHPTFLETFQMERDGLADQLQGLSSCFPYRDAPRKVWHMRAPGVVTLFDDDHEIHDETNLLSPAWRSTLTRVLGGSSNEALPAIVTLPGFKGWRN